MHKHILNKFINVPICKICNCFINSDYYNYTAINNINELESYPFEIYEKKYFKLKKLKNNLLYLNSYNENKIYINKRKKLIEKLKKIYDIYNISNKIFHHSIFLFDYVIKKEKINNYKFNYLEKLMIGCFILTLKFYHNQINIPDIDIILKYWSKISYNININKINLEFNILKILNFKLNFNSFFILYEYFNAKGIIFNDDINNNINFNYFHFQNILNDILYKIIINYSYTNFNILYLVFSVISITRELFGMKQWHNNFKLAYDINLNEIEKYNLLIKNILNKEKYSIKNYFHNNNNNNNNYHNNNFINSNGLKTDRKLKPIKSFNNLLENKKIKKNLSMIMINKINISQSKLHQNIKKSFANYSNKKNKKCYSVGSKDNKTSRNNINVRNNILNILNNYKNVHKSSKFNLYFNSNVMNKNIMNNNLYTRNKNKNLNKIFIFSEENKCNNINKF